MEFDRLKAIGVIRHSSSPRSCPLLMVPSLMCPDALVATTPTSSSGLSNVCMMATLLETFTTSLSSFMATQSSQSVTLLKQGWAFALFLFNLFCSSKKSNMEWLTPSLFTKRENGSSLLPCSLLKEQMGVACSLALYKKSNSEQVAPSLFTKRVTRSDLLPHSRCTIYF